MTPLLNHIVRHEIQSRGPITFARFMELALYHPEHGYYASGRARIGRKGDFFTNVSVGSVFGKLLAVQFAEIWEKLGRPRKFTIVEQGAQDGQFAADVLNALQTTECFGPLRYVIIEPFPIWRERQQQTLNSVIPSEVEGSRDGISKVAPRNPSTSLGMTAFQQNKVSWIESVDQLQSFTGIHFSNELFDALPVHLLSHESGKWEELFVLLNGGEFDFQKRPCSGALRPPNAKVTDGYITEASLAAPKLMRDIAAKLARGVILSIDYGFTREGFYSPERKRGTLQTRAQHRKLASPFEKIGCADISARVEWTSLIEAAQSAGAKFIGLTDQHHFLSGILTELFSETALTAADRRALQTLLHPEMLGRAFQVLALGKEFPGQPGGFRFGRGPIAL